MGPSPTPKAARTLIACDRCKKNKQGCNKIRPSCSRCSRLGVKCTYLKSPETSRTGAGLATSPKFPLAPISLWSSLQSLSRDDQITSQALGLLSEVSEKGGDVDTLYDTYFCTFHESLPIIDKDVFYGQLRHEPTTSHFATLLLSMIVVAHLSSRTADTAQIPHVVFPVLKGIFSLLQATGKVSVELIQAGVLIASYEFCQSLGQDAWLSIGASARMGHVLGIHETIKIQSPKGELCRVRIATKRCLWWGIVVVERAITAEYDYKNLPFASQDPELTDVLPTPALSDEEYHRVSDDLVLPSMVKEEKPELLSREFTRMSRFESTVQATYLSSLVMKHINISNDDHILRNEEFRNLDITLHSFCAALIPPPEKATGRYCGSFGVRTSATLALNTHYLSLGEQEGDFELVSESIRALRGVVRTMTLSARTAMTRESFDLDRRAFWTHSLFAKSAFLHIKYNARDEQWESDLEALKQYLRYFAPRYKIHENYLREIKALQ